MATLSTTELNWLAREWEKLYGSAVLSGIVGDLAHKARGGYHISRQDQGSGNYSVTRADDKLGPSDRASAIDMTMNTADMIKCHKRLRAIFQAGRTTDPRMKYINAWNGWDGQGGAGRYDVVKGTVGSATADHKWHIHLEIRRRYVNDHKAMIAILSMLKGESLADYQGKTPVSTPTKPPVVVKPPTTAPKPTTPTGGNEEIVTETQLIAALNKWASSPDGRTAIAQAVGATDNVFNTPTNFIGADGQPIYKTNAFLTLKDILYRTANLVTKVAADVAELKKANESTAPTTPVKGSLDQ